MDRGLSIRISKVMQGLFLKNKKRDNQQFAVQQYRDDL